MAKPRNSDRDSARYYSLRKPCGNCPFRRDSGAIALRPGRLAGIVAELVHNDRSTFACHKTTHGTGYGPRGDGELLCAGAAAYLLAHDRPTVGMRLAFALRIVPLDHWAPAAALVLTDIADAPTD